MYKRRETVMHSIQGDTKVYGQELCTTQQVLLMALKFDELAKNCSLQILV